jgi:hypothetical protein
MRWNLCVRKCWSFASKDSGQYSHSRLGCGSCTLLRLSPLGVVPQRNRLLWLIVDFTYSFVNDKTARLAPSKAMQFGKAL